MNELLLENALVKEYRGNNKDTSKNGHEKEINQQSYGMGCSKIEPKREVPYRERPKQEKPEIDLPKKLKPKDPMGTRPISTLP